MKPPQTIGRVAARQRTRGVAPAPVPRATSALEHEELVVRRGRRSGAQMVVAIHSTVLGPALGGLRLWSYADPVDGVFDALRLAAGMTYKAAAAGLDLGGGKGVICAPPGSGPPAGKRRREMLLDFGDLVESLGGRYITAEDVGTATEDMVAIAERTGHVTGMPTEGGGAGDPSPFTAMGVEAAIRACVAARRGDRDLNGVTVVVVGLGHVGGGLALRLAAGRRRARRLRPRSAQAGARGELGARWLELDEAFATECDVLAPCALGGAIDRATVTALRTEIVCGAANNQLAEEGLAAELASRGILYAPDFIANAGGLMCVYRELRGHDEAWAESRALGIEQTMARILATARARAADAACGRAGARTRAARRSSARLTR